MVSVKNGKNGMGALAVAEEGKAAANDAVEKYAGFKLKDQDPAVVSVAVKMAKDAGNKLFKEKKYAQAAEMYGQAIAGDGKDHALYSNRSAAFLALGRAEDALTDAQCCVEICDTWPKAYYRLGNALVANDRLRDAVIAFRHGLSLDETNSDMAAKLKETEREFEEHRERMLREVSFERRDLVLKLRDARRNEHRQAILNQFKQSMSAPEWEIEDYEWRPTFLPAMRSRPVDAVKFNANSTAGYMTGYINAIAELEHPKKALEILDDAQRCAAYRHALSEMLGAHTSDDHRASGDSDHTHIITLGTGTGILPLLTAVAAAPTAQSSASLPPSAVVISVFDRSRMMYRMTRQAIESNVVSCNHGVSAAPYSADSSAATRGTQDINGAGDAGASSVAAGRGVSGEEKSDESHGGRPLPGAVNFHLVTQSILGCGVDEERDEAKTRPSTEDGGNDDVFTALRDFAAQAAETRRSARVNGVDDDVSGSRIRGSVITRETLHCKADVLVTDLFDHTGLGLGILERLDYAAHNLLRLGARVFPSKLILRAQLVEFRLSNVSNINLSFMNAYRWYPGAEKVNLKSMLEQKHESYRVLSDPFEVDALDLQARVDAVHAAANGSNPDDCGGKADETSRKQWTLDVEKEISVTTSGVWNGVALWFELSHGGQTIATSYDPHPDAKPASFASSFGQALFYVDEIPVEADTGVSLRMQHDDFHIVLTSDPPSCRARHALIPSWHYDMLLDNERNEAYERSIAAAVQRKRDFGCKDILTLDLGAGSGILSMLAARAGSDSVVGAEQSAHMCDVGEECEVMNGFAPRCLLLNRDARRMDTKPKPDGTPPDLDRKADIVVYEVFDSGLIGEGVFHILASAKTKLAKDDATLLPCGATVFAQPIQMRVGDVCGLDFAQLNRWRWRPDYEGTDLVACRDRWTPLAPPQEIFSFDFYEWETNMTPAKKLVDFTVDTPGVVNAIAFWFDLHLDDEIKLSTSPYAEKGPTWQQAVQYIEELRVEEGSLVPVYASHDTFGISFTVDNTGIDRFAMRSGVPVIDPVWKAQHDKMQATNSQLTRTIAQNPLEYRRVASAAVEIASRPGDVGADAQAAAEYLKRMMS